MKCSFGRSLLAFALIVLISQGASADTIADSADDWSFDGVQGENNWFNGYYNLTLDEEEGDGEYQADDFIAFLNDDSLEVFEDDANHWDGSIWRLYRDTPDTAGQQTGPWTRISQNGGHPNGTNSAAPILVDDPRQDLQQRFALCQSIAVPLADVLFALDGAIAEIPEASRRATMIYR